MLLIHMEWIKAISELLGSIAWPSVLALVLILFRKEIRRRLASVTEVKYPGGSVILKEVEKLEAKVEIPKGATSQLMLPPTVGVLTPASQSDSKVAIAQMRVDVERELFRLSWRGIRESEVTGWHITRHVDELQRANILAAPLADNLRSFIEVANKILHQSDVPEELVIRAVAVGGSLVSSLRHKRFVIEAEYDFGGGHWHMDRKMGNVNRKYYFWSVVATTIPEFGYDYEIYREAAERRNENIKKRRPDYPWEELYMLSLEEFVAVLEFRERELQRLVKVGREHGSWDDFQKANKWEWPDEWGELQWNCSIIRDRFCLFEAEQELVQTRTSLEWHRSKLLSECKG